MTSVASPTITVPLGSRLVGSTAFTVTAPAGLTGPIPVTIRPTPAELEVLNIDVDDLTVINTATNASVPCVPNVDEGLLHCSVPGPGQYVIIVIGAPVAGPRGGPAPITAAPQQSSGVAGAATLATPEPAAPASVVAAAVAAPPPQAVSAPAGAVVAPAAPVAAAPVAAAPPIVAVAPGSPAAPGLPSSGTGGLLATEPHGTGHSVALPLLVVAALAGLVLAYEKHRRSNEDR